MRCVSTAIFILLHEVRMRRVSTAIVILLSYCETGGLVKKGTVHVKDRMWLRR